MVVFVFSKEYNLPSKKGVVVGLKVGDKLKVTDFVPYAAFLIERQLANSIVFGENEEEFQDIFSLSEAELLRESSLLATKAFNDLQTDEIDSWDLEDIRMFIVNKNYSYLTRLILWLALRDQPG